MKSLSRANSLQPVDTTILYRLFNPQVPVILCAKFGRHVAAMPANSCMAVSHSPSLVAVAIRRGSKTNSVVSQRGSFSINWVSHTANKSKSIILKLSAEVTFKKNEPDKLRAFNIPYTSDRGIPILNQSEAFAVCRVKKVERTGDHDLFIASAEYAMASTDFTTDQYWRFKKYKPALYLGSIRRNPVITISPFWK